MKMYYTMLFTVPMVGVEGFEPPTSCSQSRRATRLRYTPIGSSNWTRTSDPMINSHLLYQLSYRGTNFIFAATYFPKEDGGGGEIRTLGRLLTYAGFQDRCIKPLCHPSVASEVYNTDLKLQCNLFFKKNRFFSLASLFDGFTYFILM